MDTDSDSSDFLPTRLKNSQDVLVQKPSDKTNNNNEMTSPKDIATKTVSSPEDEENEKENFPLSPDDKECFELNSRPSRRAAVKAQGKITQVQTPISQRKESSSRTKREIQSLEESEKEDNEDDASFSEDDDTEDSAFEDSDSESSLLKEDTRKKGKKRRGSTSCPKKTPNSRVSKGDQPQKKNVKATQANKKSVKSDVTSKSNIPVKSIRSGLSSGNQTRMESSHVSRLLHVRPIRAGLSKKSPIPRLHSTFMNRS